MRRETWVTAKYPLHDSHVREVRTSEARVKRDLTYTEDLVEVKDARNALTHFANHMQQPDAAGIVIANHDQHVNIAGFLKIVKIINQETGGSLNHHLLVTLSLLNGDQGARFQRFALGMNPLLAENKMQMTGIMRPKDAKEFYEPEGTKSKEELAQDIRRGARNIRFVQNRFAAGEVVWFFPAGTTTEGVVDPKTGKEHGMDDIDNESIAMFIRTAAKHDKNLLILPLSLNGFNRIVPARKTEPTPEARRTIIRNTLLRWTEKRHLAEVVVGNTFRPDELLTEGVDLTDGQAVNRAALRRIAENVVPERRGKFA